MSPFFSINIPAYNCGELILDALRSVAKQSFENWEIVIVDDGSTDSTEEVCKKQTIVPRNKVKYIRKENEGQYLTRAELVSESDGAFVVSLDADDALLDRGTLAKLYAMLAESNCDVVLFNATRSASARRSFIDYGGLDVDDAGNVSMSSVFKELYCSYNLNNVCTKVYRRELSAFGIADRVIRNTEDRLQCIELFQNVRTCSLLDEPLYYYRRNPRSVTNSSYSFSYFEDLVFVEEQAEKILASMVDNEARLRRESFLCRVVASNLQRLHDSTPSRAERIESYASALALCVDSGIFPDKAARTTPDSIAVYSAFVSGKFGRLDFLLGGRGAVREVINKIECR